MDILKFGAVDIGTNAVRLLITSVFIDKLDTTLKKDMLVRLPLRLGEDVFETGNIGAEKIDKLIHGIHAFKHLVHIQDVMSYRVCATSAMREAKNSNDVIKIVKSQTGVEIEVISGKEEAELICAFQMSDKWKKKQDFLFVDVGGGSTEITLFSNQKALISNSFNVGTIRVLKNQPLKDELKNMQDWLKDLSKKYETLQIVGSGGNINKIFKMSTKQEGSPLIYNEIDEINEFIKRHSIDQRIKILGMNPDRADVIVPAAEIFLKVMKWARADVLHVQKIGLADGVTRQVYSEYLANKNKK